MPERVSPQKQGVPGSVQGCAPATFGPTLSTLITVRAESITESIPERAGPVIYKSFFTGINNFQTDSSNLSCKKSKAWKLLETIIHSKQGLPRNKNQ